MRYTINARKMRSLQTITYVQHIYRNNEIVKLVDHVQLFHITKMDQKKIFSTKDSMKTLNLKSIQEAPNGWCIDSLRLILLRFHYVLCDQQKILIQVICNMTILKNTFHDPRV